MKSSKSRDKFELAYELHADVLYRTAVAFLGNGQDAENVVHDVFIKYMTSIASFEDEKKERAWLLRVCANKCKDLLRKGKREDHDVFEEFEHSAPTENDSVNAIVKALQAVDEKYKEVLILHYLEGYSVLDIAKILKLSPSGVKMRLSRGREMLKAAYLKEKENV